MFDLCMNLLVGIMYLMCVLISWGINCLWAVTLYGPMKLYEHWIG